MPKTWVNQYGQIQAHVERVKRSSKEGGSGYRVTLSMPGVEPYVSFERVRYPIFAARDAIKDLAMTWENHETLERQLEEYSQENKWQKHLIEDYVKNSRREIAAAREFGSALDEAMATIEDNYDQYVTQSDDPSMGNGSVRNLRLKDLLPDSVIHELEPVMNDIADGSIDTSEGKKRISEVLEPQRAELERRGVLADYLAWVLVSIASKSGGHLGSVQVS